MTRTAFSKILIANRGEIACRVIRSARSEGYRTVAVYSDADAQALHVRQADEALRIGAAPARDSYLNIDALLAAAAASGADAVHPGYGFHSENAGFARACQQAGLVFIGPDPLAIEQMGNKAAAKRLMRAAGVPCVPGYDGDDASDETLLAQARGIGVPIMVKAAAGGGGRGMRRVRDLAELPAAIATARSESASAFGSGQLILERAITQARHVEIQIFGDRHGHLIHLGERDCSIQRRHQKVFEEAPSPAVDAALRERMGAAAVAAARAVDYVGAGTVEFLLDPDGRFFFLEMNTRLQVEHPVTECITGLDLVAWQLAVARGEPLPLTQSDVQLRGHAIEARLYAEDPAAGFLPQSGAVALWRPPAGAGIRVDHGLAEGQAISPHYDPLLAKIIAHGASRDEARRRLLGALRETRVLGLTTNLGFLEAAAAHPQFAAGTATTGFIERCFDAASLQPRAAGNAMVALAASLWFERSSYRGAQRNWRSSGAARWPLELAQGGRRHAVHVTAHGADRHDIDPATAHGTSRFDVDPCGEHGANRFDVDLGGERCHEVVLGESCGANLRPRIDGLQRPASFAFTADTLHLALDGAVAAFDDVTYAAPGGSGERANESTIAAPMNGRVLAVFVQAGDAVVRGQRLAVLEAMKMEHPLLARRDGVVERVAVQAGDQVGAQVVVITLAEPTVAGQVAP